MGRYLQKSTCLSPHPLDVAYSIRINEIIMPLQKKLSDYLTFLSQQPRGFVYRDADKKRILKTAEQASLHAITSLRNTTAGQAAEQVIAGQPCKKKLLDELNSKYVNCQECPLATQGRKQVVFGKGNAETLLMFVGEGPGKDEDEQGSPFVGRAGQLLTKIIEAMGLTREQVYISNVVKCRPPGNRVPLPIESDTCKNILLFKEIEIIKPKIICTLGATATRGLLGEEVTISKARGLFFDVNGILIMPTYHPAYLLRNPAEKRTVWEDMKKIVEKLKEVERSKEMDPELVSG